MGDLRDGERRRNGKKIEERRGEGEGKNGRKGKMDGINEGQENRETLAR